ncbi:MAG: DUF4132 domain-containing protein [Actinomycetia bacterium]|nr:DUF4132 domain-containing protein [Actinomycetes bacterium]
MSEPSEPWPDGAGSSAEAGSSAPPAGSGSATSPAVQTTEAGRRADSPASPAEAEEPAKQARPTEDGPVPEGSATAGSEPVESGGFLLGAMSAADWAAQDSQVQVTPEPSPLPEPQTSSDDAEPGSAPSAGSGTEDASAAEPEPADSATDETEAEPVPAGTLPGVPVPAEEPATRPNEPEPAEPSDGSSAEPEPVPLLAEGPSDESDQAESSQAEAESSDGPGAGSGSEPESSQRPEPQAEAGPGSQPDEPEAADPEPSTEPEAAAPEATDPSESSTEAAEPPESPTEPEPEPGAEAPDEPEASVPEPEDEPEWLSAGNGLQLTIRGHRIVARTASTRAELAEVPREVWTSTAWDQLSSARDFLIEHDREAGRTVERWMLRSLPVPRVLLTEVWADEAWRSWLTNLVVTGNGVTGVLRDIPDAESLQLMDVHRALVRCDADQVCLPHPALLPELDQLQVLASARGYRQRLDQLRRTVHRLDPEQAGWRSLLQWSGARFSKLSRGQQLAASLGYRIRGGYAECVVYEGGARVVARYWIGVEHSDDETFTADLCWERNGRVVPVGRVGPVAYSEGVRMASAIYAGREASR